MPALRAAAAVALAAVALVLCLTACSPSHDDGEISADARAHDSDQILEFNVYAPNEPGCSAAVGVDGRVVWHGVQGLADLQTKSRITAETTFNLGSVSKQFTATAILLLAGDNRLRLSDTLATYVDGLPDWANRVTIQELIHHTSGIPDYIQLLGRQGYEIEKHASQAQAVSVVAGEKTLRFAPGTDWEYSNSNYLLLAEVVRNVSHQTLARFLASRIFEPLDLDMVLEPIGPVTDHAASSYVRTGNGFYRRHSLWAQVGATGVVSSASDLVVWGDNYRTGYVGGPDLLTATVAEPVDTGATDGSPDRYAAGMFLSRDGTLSHLGDWEGFVSAFEVSPDRHTSVAVLCNIVGEDPRLIAEELREIWF